MVIWRAVQGERQGMCRHKFEAHVALILALAHDGYSAKENDVNDASLARYIPKRSDECY